MKLIANGPLLSRVMRFCLVLSLVCISACQNEHKTVTNESGTGSLVGVNYTGNGIQWFTVDGASGASVGSYSGGGKFSCCASYPKEWRQDIKVRVKWERSDGLEPNGKRWRIKPLETVVNVEKYVTEGDVYVLFLPDDKISVYVSPVGIGNPNFPTDLGSPEDAEKGKNIP